MPSFATWLESVALRMGVDESRLTRRRSYGLPPTPLEEEALAQATGTPLADIQQMVWLVRRKRAEEEAFRRRRRPRPTVPGGAAVVPPIAPTIFWGFNHEAGRATMK